MAATSEKPEIVETLLARLIDGSDVHALVSILNAIIEGSGKEDKEELVCGFLPSVQFAVSGATTDLESYAHLRSRIYPLLDQNLRAVWRHWEEHLPFDAAASLPK